ncbi:MAG: electron transfer flavoprotein subunit alpha/FixB family protein [Vicinamibacteria bacterium]
MILVIAEQKNGALNRASWEAIAAAQQLAAGRPVKVAVLGQGVAPVATELAQADVAEVLAVESDALAVYTPDAFVQAVQQVIAAENPAYVCFTHTYQTRDFAPTLAARLDRALVTDVIAVRLDGGTPAFARPMFQGKLVADVEPLGPEPHLISLQIGALRADQAARGAGAPVRQVAVTIDAASIRQQAEAPFQEARAAVDLSQAERIVAVGRGIKAQENVAVAETLAKAFGAELAASRPICDNGWLPMERQIGSSGQTVAPKLYVALGISGAIQHLVGMKGARTIVAINKDAEAPIFEVADYGIAGDLFEIAPALVAELEKT